MGSCCREKACAGTATRYSALSHTTRKDNDLTSKLRLPAAQREALRAQCAADADPLRSLNIMDYSLVLGIHRAHRGAHRSSTRGVANTDGADRHVESTDSGPLAFSADIESSSCGDVYYVCIIDLLQTWTIAKRLERLLKMTLCCRCGRSASGMSVVEPQHYASRFIRMIDRIL